MDIKDERKELVPIDIYEVGNLVDIGEGNYGLVIASQGHYDLIDPTTGESWYRVGKFKSLDELSTFFYHSGDVSVNATLVISSNV